jgi:hypothetical protein
MKYYEDWTRQASCAEIGGDEWFPEVHGDYRSAKRICLTQCPVKSECLDYAMRLEEGKSHSIRHGLFGGMFPDARAKYEPEWLASQAQDTAA